MHRPTIHAARRSAFSLLELLLVLSISGILAGATAVALLRTGERANVKATEVGLDTLKGALTDYRFSVGAFPTTQEGLQALVPNYVEQRALQDPWKRAYLYTAPTGDPNRPFMLSSAGPDGEFGTGDDISVWDVTG
ncbi:MAG: type II secretion system protein GspG [Phycisphaerales bacterium]